MTQQGTAPPKRLPLTGWRRVVLVGAGGLLLGLAVVTVAPSVPRPVAVEVHVENAPAEGLRVRSVITSEGEVVVESDEVVRGPGRARLSASHWLRPEPHVLEVRGRGCRRVERRFTPGETDHVSVVYRCR